VNCKPGDLAQGTCTAKKDGMPPLSAERLRELFDYEPATGEFKRRHPTRNGHKAGSVAGTAQKNRKPYLIIKIDGRLYYCHRLAWLYVYGEMPDALIDHINGDGMDNRICNLRPVTNQQNLQASKKTPKHNTSGLTGAHYSKRMKAWIAGISVDDKRKHIGTFATAEDAHAAYLAEKKKVHFQ